MTTPTENPNRTAPPRPASHRAGADKGGIPRRRRWWLRPAAPVSILAGLTLAVGLCPLASGASSYVVAPGDNLSSISAQFGVSVSALAAANGISDPNLVDAGATLEIPSAAGGTAAVTGSSGSYPPELAYYPDRLALVPTFEQAASQAGIPVSLLEGITWQESGWQAGVVSPAGAIGVGQLTPDTVAFVRAVLDPAALDPWVATDNIVISAQFLGYLLNQTGGNEQLAIAAYYQGLGAVQQYGILPVSQQYVADVMALQGEF